MTFLRKRADSPHAARARELLSRGVQVKERDDFIAFIAPDDCFLSLGDESVLGELNAALDSIHAHSCRFTLNYARDGQQAASPRRECKTTLRMLGELNAALDSCGIEKRAKAERTDESLMADDVERGRSPSSALFTSHVSGGLTACALCTTRGMGGGAVGAVADARRLLSFARRRVRARRA